MKKCVITAATALSALLLCSAVARAAETTCSGTLTGGTYDNIVVPFNQVCVLDGVRVTGKVTVSTGAGLTVTNFTGPTTIGGDIKADGCDIVVLDSHSSIGFIVVGGDLNIQNCNILTYAVQGDAAPRVLIGGDVKCIGNNSCLFSRDVIGGSLNCSGNLFGCFLADIEIGGTATLNDNSGAGISVGANVIGGDLKCNGNAAATSLVANLVAGTKSGQCSAF